MITCVSPSAKHLASTTDYEIEASVFCDGAYDIDLPTDMRDCAIKLIHNNRSHDDWILLYLLVDEFSLRNCKIDLVLPYISYGRQRPEYLQALLRPLQRPSVTRISTIDLHQDRDGITNLSLAHLIATDIKDRNLDGCSLIAPDRGSICRVQQLAALTGQHVVALQKQRSPGVVTISSTDLILTSVEAIIIDDMIDTGLTLKASVDFLLEQGVPAVHVYATHGVLSYGLGDWAKNLTSLTFANTLCPADIQDIIRWIDVKEILRGNSDESKFVEYS